MGALGALYESPTQSTTLYERVDELIRSHKDELLCTAGTHAAIEELIVRSEGLEEAIREIARAIQELAAAQHVGEDPQASPG